MSIAENRRARFDYELGQAFEAGLMLTGSEVKALRAGRANIAEAYVGTDGGELWLVNAQIEVLPGTRMGPLGGHEPKRRRKLLVRRAELDRIDAEVRRAGMSAVPLALYWNERGLAKLRFSLAKGKKTHDKRASIKERDWSREKARLLKGA